MELSGEALRACARDVASDWMRVMMAWRGIFGSTGVRLYLKLAAISARVGCALTSPRKEKDMRSESREFCTMVAVGGVGEAVAGGEGVTEAGGSAVVTGDVGAESSVVTDGRRELWAMLKSA